MVDLCLWPNVSASYLVGVTSSRELCVVDVSRRKPLDVLKLLHHVLTWIVDLGNAEVFIPYSEMPTLILLFVTIVSVRRLWLRRHISHDPVTLTPGDEDETNHISELLEELSVEIQRLEDRVACVEQSRDRLGAGDSARENEGLERFAKEVSQLQERLSRVEEQCEKLKQEERQREVPDEDEEMGLSFPCAVERGDPPSWLLEQRLEDTISQMRNESAHSVALTHELHAMRNNLEVARKQRQSIVRDFKTLMTDVGLERTLTSDAIRDAVSQLKKMPYGVRALNIAVGVLETIHSHISFGQHLRLRRVASFLSKYDSTGEEENQVAFSTTF